MGMMMVEKIGRIPREKFMEYKPYIDKYFDAMKKYSDSVEKFTACFIELKKLLVEKGEAYAEAEEAERYINAKLINLGNFLSNGEGGKKEI